MYNIRSGAFNDKWLTSNLMEIVMLAFFQRLLVKIATWKIWPWKFRSRWRRTIFAITPIDVKCQYLQTSLITFFTFAKVRSEQTKVRHTHTETDKPIAKGEILKICLKKLNPTIGKMCKTDLPKITPALITVFVYDFVIIVCEGPVFANRSKLNTRGCFCFSLHLCTHLMPLLTLARHCRVCCHPFTTLRCESDFWRGCQSTRRDA